MAETYPAVAAELGLQDLTINSWFTAVGDMPRRLQWVDNALKAPPACLEAAINLRF